MTTPLPTHSPRGGLRSQLASVGVWTLSLASVVACGSDADAGASGQVSSYGRAEQPIIGGALDEATSGVVGLALDLGGRVAGHCSGTLIAPNLVLTARHCVAFTDDPDAEGIVQCDTAQFESPFPPSLLLASPNPVRPTQASDPSYVRGREVRTLGDSKVCGFDIALIILEGDGIPASIRPISPRLERAPLDRELFSTVGYGLTNPDDPGSDGTRQRAEGSAVRCSREDCVTLSDGAIRDSEWASVDAPICSGDSGGPALDEQGRVFGVASRGDQNCEIAVYGDVSSWAPFIIDTALDAATLGDYAAPSWTTELDAPALATKLGADSRASGGGCSTGGRPGRHTGGFCLALAMLVCFAWIQRRRPAAR